MGADESVLPLGVTAASFSPSQQVTLQTRPKETATRTKVVPNLWVNDLY